MFNNHWNIAKEKGEKNQVKWDRDAMNIGLQPLPNKNGIVSNEQAKWGYSKAKEKD